MTGFTLLILAAGMGSRYGGLKQLDEVGPHGEVLMEYSIYDALKAGAEEIVFVIRRDFEEAFRDTLLSRLPAPVSKKLVFQELTDLPGEYETTLDLSKRLKPWGTAHAVWSARDQLKERPFLSINADDYYGPTAYRRMAEYLGQTPDPHPAMVGFRLDRTLSPSGTVSRGICQVEDGRLTKIQERTALRRSGSQEAVDEATGELHPLDTLVSMNFWGLGPSYLDFLESELRGFLEKVKQGEADLARGEFYLPETMELWRSATNRPVTVLASDDRWLGVTYPEDKAEVTRGLVELIDAGTYPASLWNP